MENEDLLWAGIPFMAGISGHQNAPCGAISAATVGLGLKFRCSIADKEKAKKARNDARNYAGKLVAGFSKKFGDITCGGLLGLDFSKSGEYAKFRESGVWKDTCEKYVAHIIAELYKFEQDPQATN